MLYKEDKRALQLRDEASGGKRNVQTKIQIFEEGNVERKEGVKNRVGFRFTFNETGKFDILARDTRKGER